MIGKITRGQDMAGLVRYLAGPGRHEEHTRPRVVAVSAGVDVPVGDVLSPTQVRELGLQLDAPAAIFGREVPGGHVWHLSLTNRADDRELTDDEWGTSVRAVMERLGFDDGGGDGRAVAPWAAIRHGRSQGGNDHVHVAVSLVREDGTRASTWQDRVKLSAACRQLEDHHGLLVVAGRTAGTTPSPARAELEVTARSAAPEPDRLVLARQVRAAASASRDEAEFVRRLRTGGFRVRPRFGTTPDQVVGYSVATPEGGGRWWGGGKLGRDLTLPALRAGWEPVDDQRAAWVPGHAAAVEGLDGRETVEIDNGAWKTAARMAGEAADRLPHDVGAGDEHAAAHAARDASGAAAALGLRLPGPDGTEWRALGDVLARSAQPVDHRPRRRNGLEGVATVAAQAALLGRSGRGSEVAGWLILAGELLRLAAVIEENHRVRGELGRAQEIAARRAAVIGLRPVLAGGPRQTGRAPHEAPLRPGRPPERDTYGR